MLQDRIIRQQKTDYRRQLRELRNKTRFSIKDIPTNYTAVPQENLVGLCKITDVEDPYYKALNEQLVFVYKKKKIKHNRYFNSGEVKDKVVTQIEPDCSAVISQQPLGLPANYESKTDKRLKYLDYVDRGKDGRYLIYQIPNDHLVFVKRTALVAVLNKRQNHYGGYKVTLTTGHNVFLYIVDYKDALATDNRLNIITVMTGLIKLVDVENLIQNWAAQGYAHELDAFDGEFNVEQDPTLDFEDQGLTLTQLFEGGTSVEDIDNDPLGFLD